MAAFLPISTHAEMLTGAVPERSIGMGMALTRDVHHRTTDVETTHPLPVGQLL